MTLHMKLQPELTAMRSHEDTAVASAVLVQRDGRAAHILRDGAGEEARIAFGCLVQPEPDDRVLTAIVDGTTWILAVLERPSALPMCLCSEGDMSIVSSQGNVSLVAAQAVNLDAGERVRLAALRIDLHAGLARFVIGELLQIGRKAELLVGRIRNVCDLVETFAEHVLTRAARSSRFVTESDHLRAGDIDHRAEATMQLNAQTMLMTADALVRLDAEQIHMG